MSLTAEQHAIRSTGIGGSEIAAVAGLSPWSRPIDIYERKLGIAPPHDTQHTRRGTYLEAGLVQWYADDLRARRGDSMRVTPVGTLRHPSHDIVLATPDGLVYDGATLERVLEIKSPGWRTQEHWGEAGTDQVPEYYLPQVTWEMACAGVEHADVWALMGEEAALYTVAFDAEFFGMLVETAQRFWRDHILAKRPPDPDGSESYGEHLKRRFSQPTGEILTATPDDDTLARELREAREALKTAETREAELVQRMKLRLGDADAIEGPGWKITHRQQAGKKSLDTKALAAEAPELVAKHTKQGNPFRVFRPTFQGEK